MIVNDTHFQYCPKLFLVDESVDSVLLARRAGEADYDGVFSLVGGKMERTDSDLLKGLSREKNEEIGIQAIVEVLLTFSHNALFMKADGNSMILPHFYARYLGGDIQINDEYSEYNWIPISELPNLSNIISNIPHIGNTLLRLRKIAEDTDFARLTT